MRHKNVGDALKWFAEHEALGGPFAADALGKLAEAVLRDKDKTRRDLENSMVSAEAWIRAAEGWARTWEQLTGKPFFPEVGSKDAT